MWLATSNRKVSQVKVSSPVKSTGHVPHKNKHLQCLPQSFLTLGVLDLAALGLDPGGLAAEDPGLDDPGLVEDRGAPFKLLDKP